QNTIIGGSSLWAMGGHTDAEYKATATFFRFLSLPMVQAYWHANTGYVPITIAAYDMMKKLKFYEANPGRDVSILQMSAKAPTPNSKGLRFGSFLQVRGMIYDELEAIFAGDKTAQEGLDSVVSRGNKLLRKFEKANK
ncbi:MAG: sn-glycerol-3-phosphate ABC transporter substrate-binding protein, partial [Alphaproteobacteria bacterium]